MSAQLGLVQVNAQCAGHAIDQNLVFSKRLLALHRVTSSQVLRA
jgi:hypothetical protein